MTNKPSSISPQCKDFGCRRAILVRFVINPSLTETKKRRFLSKVQGSDGKETDVRGNTISINASLNGQLKSFEVKSPVIAKQKSGIGSFCILIAFWTISSRSEFSAEIFPPQTQKALNVKLLGDRLRIGVVDGMGKRYTNCGIRVQIGKIRVNNVVVQFKEL